MNTLRKIIGKTRVDRVRNQVITEQREMQPIGDCVNKCREERNRFQELERKELFGVSEVTPQKTEEAQEDK
jgi:hypothetical protein